MTINDLLDKTCPHPPQRARHFLYDFSDRALKKQTKHNLKLLQKKCKEAEKRIKRVNRDTIAVFYQADAGGQGRKFTPAGQSNLLFGSKLN
jgi:hypothetical protein